MKISGCRVSNCSGLKNTVNSPRPKRLTLASAVALSLCSPLSVHAVALEEVVVTAQKRVQNLQDVPISVSVMTGEKLEQFSVGGMEEMSASMPNVTIAENATQDSVTIRAIGSGANHGFEQSVGTFIDGVYFGRGRSSRSPFLDAERVEVLKGPQGVLFGKNTIAGALNITTRKPSEEFEASIEADYFFEGDESYSVTGIVSGAISDTVAARLVVKTAESDGFVKNLQSGDYDPQDEEQVIRTTVVIDPSDELSILLKAEAASFDQDGRSMQIVAGGVLEDIVFRAVDPLYEDKLDWKRSVNSAAFGEDYDNTDTYNLTATVKYDFENVSLVSTTAGVGYEYDNSISANFSANTDTAVKLYEEEQKQFSQELRLESNLDGSFQYIAGVFYQSEEIDHLQFFKFNTVVLNSMGLAPFADGFRTYDLVQDTESLAAFAQGTWEISDSLRTTVGLRYTRDEKDLDYDYSKTGAVPGPAATVVDDSRTDDDLTPSLNIQYDIDPDMMAYVTLSQGFKSGGFDFESGAQFEEETVDAFEVGVKSTLLDGSLELNLALFSSEFTDLQTAAWNGEAFITGNAASSSTEGLEVDFRWQLSESFLLTGALALLSAEYDDFEGAQCSEYLRLAGACPDGLQDLSGKDLPFAPEYSGTVSLEYSKVLSGGLELAAIVGVDFTDSYFTAQDLDPISEQDSFSKVNVRVELASDQGWTVALIGKNLTNEATTTWVNDIPLFNNGAHFASIDPQRTYGVQFKYEL